MIIKYFNLFAIVENKNRLLRTVLYFIIAQGLLMISAFVFEFLIVALDIKSGFEDEEIFTSLQHKYTLVLIVGPLFETLVFNLMTNEILLKIVNTYIVIFISSFIFASIHYYSVYYIIHAFTGALIMNAFYFYCRRNWSVYHAFILVLFLHFNHNLLGIILGK